MTTVDGRYLPFLSLPDLAVSPPRPVGGETACIALIPLFFDAYTNPENIIAFARSAIYSRCACLRFTDAVAENVEVKFFVDYLTRHKLNPIFEANGIEASDIVYFSALPLPDVDMGFWAYLSKKTIPFWFPVFSAYDAVVVWDADLLFLPTAEKISFFKGVKQLTTRGIGYIRRYATTEWDWKTHLSDATKLSDLKVDALIKMVGGPTSFETVIHHIGGVSIYPAKYYHATRPDFITWMHRRAPYIGDDEVCALFYSEKFGIRTYDISEELDVSMIEYMGAVLGTEATLFHCTPTKGTEDFFFQVMHAIAGVEDA
ncbi:hypothetical protein F4Z99_18445 [Candidatus Poribacteria bacterium]|nr:hypothetical protein [Candidatus Poribacteria bacterium]MYB02590.1 hypothetical protein [Candidatus Poribacteria bacterium]